MFDKVLIANRGVIAVRIIEACKELGIKTIAVYTPDDETSMHVKLANDAFCISNYDDEAEYISICEEIEADKRKYNIAIHPGYGFLAENEVLGEVCKYHNISLVGPRPDVIERLGNKLQAKEGARKTKVETVPGTGEIETEKDALKQASRLSYPIMIKAVAGGGGRGIERVNSERELIPTYRRVKGLAKILFRNDAVFFEKAVDEFRHIEVQIVGYGKQNVVHFYERDCSIQRRNQKLIEFSPADISESLREKLTDSALRVARYFDYTNAGTVEFIVAGNNVYFMEVNTRIQVEHRVSEMLTGVDLAKQQFEVAANDKYFKPLKQKDINRKGFALECRIYAEDPEKDFWPTPGVVERIEIPTAPYLIVDTHLYNGYKVGSTYDALIANVIVHGKDKEDAVEKMRKSLLELKIEGEIKTTIPFHLEKIKEL
ncbi:ATP-grasp domain-containing protein [Candidatus Pacearchaeota archaeon]|nr:ATP-grasp domain-containing protein [Candidatus Pacearchaeota archaeon]